MAKITRAEVLARAKARRKTWYSQSVVTDGYRDDCSGFVSWCYKLTAGDVPGGYYGGGNTVSLVASNGPLYEIPLNDLKPGDACGNCGPGSAGDAGHIVLFDRWYNNDPNNNDYYIYEQAGGQVGPTHRLITWPYPGESRWKAYRFRGIADTEDDLELTDKVSLNGWIGDEFPDIKAAKNALTVNTVLGSGYGHSRHARYAIDDPDTGLKAAHTKMDAMAKDMAALKASLAKVQAPTVTVDAKAVETAIDAAVNAALAKLQYTVSPKASA